MFRSKLVLASLIAVFWLCSQVQADDPTPISWDGGGDDNSWSNEYNWSLNIVPDNNDIEGKAYAVTINAGVDEVDIGLQDNYTINKLDCYSQVDGQVDLEGRWGWRELTLVDTYGLRNHGNLEIEWINIRGNVTNLTGKTLELCDMDIEGNLYNELGATIGIDYEVWVDKLEGAAGTGNLENYGTIEIYPAGQLGVEGSFDNSGTILIYGGECGADDEVLENRGVIGGFGIVYGEEQVWNDEGRIIASGGSLVVVSEGSLINSGLLRNEPLASLQIKPWLHTEPGYVNNYGSIEVNAGGGVAFDCGLVNESGTIELRGGTLAAENITQSAGATFEGGGTIACRNLLIESSAEIELNGPTIIVGDVNIVSGGTLMIRPSQTFIGGHTTNDGTIVLAGGTVIFRGGYTGSGNIIHATPPFNRVAHWQMDDNAANTLVDDSSGYDNDGTAQQDTVNMSTSGVVDGALSFNGTDDYIDIGSNPIPSSGDWTLAGWVYCEGALGGTTDDWATAFGSASWSGLNVQGAYVYIGAGALRVSIGNGVSASNGIAVTDITGANANTWYHLVMVYDSVSEQTKVYVNGAYSLTIYQAYDQSNVNFTIGNSLGLHASQSHWYGNIDNVMIFNEALTEGQIQEVYNE